MATDYLANDFKHYIQQLLDARGMKVDERVVEAISVGLATTFRELSGQ